MTTKFAHLARRTTVVLAATAVVLTAAGPAGADVPEGWSNPEPVSPWHALLVLGGIPLALFVVIALLVLLPGRLRGERLGQSRPVDDNEWFGGPRKGTDELPAPDNEESKAGGASARW